ARSHLELTSSAYRLRLRLICASARCACLLHTPTVTAKPPRIPTVADPGRAIPQQSPQNRPRSRPPPNLGAQYRNSHRKTAPDPPQRPAVGSLSPRPCRFRRTEECDARKTGDNNSLSTH